MKVGLALQVVQVVVVAEAPHFKQATLVIPQQLRRRRGTMGVMQIAPPQQIQATAVEAVLQQLVATEAVTHLAPAALVALEQRQA